MDKSDNISQSIQQQCMNPKDRKRTLLKKAENEEQNRDINENPYRILPGYIGKGISSHVLAAIDLRIQKKVAIKRIKNFLQNKHESLRVLREIILLRQLKHPNVIDLQQIILEGGNPRELSLVLEYFPLDIKKVMKSNIILGMRTIKEIIFQILMGLSYCQQSQVLHRDLKPQNILVTDDLSQVKLCDFGLARAVTLEEEEEEPTMQKEQTGKSKNNLTAHVTTRWYRAPQLILLVRKYNSAIDIWSVGCILGQLLTMRETSFTDRKPLFPGKACYPLSPPKSSDVDYRKVNDFPHSVYDQLSVIFNIIGTPKDISFITDERAKNYLNSFNKIQRKSFQQLFKFVDKHVEDFLERSLEFNPTKRMNIVEALNHPLFDDIRDKFKTNLEIKGEPIVMELQEMEIEDIGKAVLKQYQYYQMKKHKP